MKGNDPNPTTFYLLENREKMRKGLQKDMEIL